MFKDDKFNFWCPIGRIEKATDEAGEPVMRIGGIASTMDKDADGEYLDPSGLDVELNESTGVITYTSTELVPLSAGTTLLLCFELADSDGRFSPSGNVVVYYDLPPANNLWGTIAGFFDNATGSNGSINARRRGAGIIDFQCTSGLLEGYPGLQVYLKHIFVLG